MTSESKVRLLSRGYLVLGLVVIATALISWYVTRDRLPDVIRIATGEPGGLYSQLGAALAKEMEAHTGRRVITVESGGSMENFEKLKKGEVQLAIVQAGPRAMSGVAKIVPLYEEPVMIFLRPESDIGETSELVERKLLVGRPESGMFWSASSVMRHYGIDPEGPQAVREYFTEIERSPQVDGTIVTTGIL
ncbi:MAG: TAXI family TRAP transporter solute-binding subunit, partial [Planctomycetota bacterium]